jgi:prefoldin subunit 5
LRKATEEIIDRIRYLNRVATSMRAGLLDVEEAAAELDATEKQLHALVDRLRNVAGVES